MQDQPVKSYHVLCVYAQSQTYTATVFEHVDSFRRYSNLSWRFLNYTEFDSDDCLLSEFDVVVWHYSARLPYGQLSSSGVEKLSVYSGLKVLFIQDEYDHTDAAKRIISSAQFDLVFSVVPEVSLSRIYPENEFPNTRFVSNFTGYVPDDLASYIGHVQPPSRRQVSVAYRGRALPIRYGRLGREKLVIGRSVKAYCERMGISSDIAWDDSARIYGNDWYRFVSSAKAMLGTESGSNVFDWDGTLQSTIDAYISENPDLSEEEVLQNTIGKREIDGLMNQLSPRIFEMAAARTVMILFEGTYSGVLVPDVHYLPLKKDFSNIDTVFATLADDEAVDAMVARTYCDIIESNKYSYQQFVNRVDNEILAMLRLGRRQREDAVLTIDMVTSRYSTAAPIRSRPPLPSLLTHDTVAFLMPLKQLVAKGLIAGWQKVPMSLRPHVKRLLGRT